MADAINIILDEGNPPYSQFIEIETDDGQSVSIGERIKDRGFIKIRITANDIKNISQKKRRSTNSAISD